MPSIPGAVLPIEMVAAASSPWWIVSSHGRVVLGVASVGLESGSTERSSSSPSLFEEASLESLGLFQGVFNSLTVDEKGGSWSLVQACAS